MANFYQDTSVRTADGKVLGRVRPMVKGATPQAGMKDYRFFVDPVSPLPRGFEEGEHFGFTGFMSRIGFEYNAFEDEESALANLESIFGDCFVSFTPVLRNNKYFVLDDMVKEGRTPFMDEDGDYYPIPAFGNLDAPAFDGDINKFCRHLLQDKPIPGMSKRYWNNEWPCPVVVAATENFENKIGPWVVFAPMGSDAFDSRVVGEGGAYFRPISEDTLGFALVDSRNSELLSHIIRCEESPLWFVPRRYLKDLRGKLRPVPGDGDLLRACGVTRNPFAGSEMEEERPAPMPMPVAPVQVKKAEPQPVKKVEKVESQPAPVKKEEGKKVEEITPPVAPAVPPKKPFGESDFLARLSEAAAADGLLYEEKDLLHFHISMKASRLVILSGRSGIGKSALVRLYGRALGLPDGQVKILPVRPSWMDDGDLLGYVDMKNMVYRSADTGLAELLIDAAKNPSKQYILCFDEMNLARVEHYFAQFISALEKEKAPTIRLYNPSLAPRLYNSDKYPAEITVGSNVIFTGTINVDESTCHFSDKILDRANVITLHQRRFRDLLTLKGEARKEYKEISADLYDSFRVKEGMGLTDKELDLLDALNDAFAKSGVPYGIGFRVASQMGRYLENIPEGTLSRGEGLDAQLVQRVLTKLRGSAEQLAALLSQSEKGNLEGSLPSILGRYKNLSEFLEATKVLKRKAGELKLYGYTL